MERNESIECEFEENTRNEFSASEKTRKISDIVTIQLIICIIAAIIYFSANIFIPEAAEEMYNSYKSNMANTAADEIYEAAADFITSPPAEYD